MATIVLGLVAHGFFWLSERAYPRKTRFADLTEIAITI
jgi:hypothetical protein